MYKMLPIIVYVFYAVMILFKSFLTWFHGAMILAEVIPQYFSYFVESLRIRVAATWEF